MSFSDDSPEAEVPETPPTPEEPAPQEDHDQAASAPEENFIPEENTVPEGFTPLVSSARLARSRRRRAHRMLVPPSADERAILLDDLARRAFPSFEFFLFALLCGAVLGAAYLLESPALLLLGLLLAPMLAPWVGYTLATITGSWIFFFETLLGLLVASGLVFLTGALAGWAGRLWAPLTLFHANIHAHLWWPDLLLVALGAGLLVVSFIRSEQKPILPSIMLAYGLFLPISSAGLGWGIGSASLWPAGALVFLVHLSLATLVSGIVLAALRFKPVRAGGYVLPVLAGLLSVTALFSFTGFVDFNKMISSLRSGITNSRQTQATPTFTVPKASFTPTVKVDATQTFTPAFTDTTAPTETLAPTPAYAVITASSGGGALVRTEPSGGTVVATLINGSIVQVLPETQTVGTLIWVKVRLTNNIQGWVLQTVLVATTQTPPPLDTFTPTP